MAAIERLRRYLALGQGERRLFLRAYVALGWVDLVLRVAGFRYLAGRARVGAAAPGGRVDPAALGRARRYARTIAVAARHHVVPAHCLHRSLVLHQWLRREGLPGELRIGVRKEGGALRAHAWVELSGSIVNDTPAAVAPFVPLTAVPAGAAPKGEQWQ